MSNLLAMFLLPFLANASSKLENFVYTFEGKSVSVPIAKWEGIRVNDICLDNQKTCLALKKFHQKSQIQRIKKSVPGNYSGAYCELLGGSQLFLKAVGKEQDTQFCTFPDLTMIDAAALYLHHYREKTR